MDVSDQARHELEGLAAEQRRFLSVSCAAFDSGDHAEAKRIAACLRALLQDPGTGQALLSELGSRDLIGWLDTAGSLLPLPDQAQTPLVHVSAEEKPGRTGTTWLPTLDAWDRRLQERPRLPASVEESLARMRAEHLLRSRGHWLPFHEWWDADVMCDEGGQKFTRADLVAALTDPAGTAAADPGLDDVHRHRPRWDTSGWAVDLDDLPRGPALGPTLSSVRQIAYEVEMSLYRADPPEVIR